MQQERKTRQSTEEKRVELLNEGLKHAISIGWENFTREAFCTHMGIAVGSINYHFKDMAGFRRAIMRKAIAKRNVQIVAGGIESRCPVAKSAPESLKKLALAYMMDN